MRNTQGKKRFQSQEGILSEKTRKGEEKYKGERERNKREKDERKEEMTLCDLFPFLISINKQFEL